MAALSVIVVTYNSASVLPTCLRSLVEHLPDAEVVVVDNGSEDNTVELVRARPAVSLISGHGNVGFGAAVNRGACAATGTMLLVLNPDATLVAVDLTDLAALSDDHRVGLLGCRVRGARTDRYLMSNSWGWRAELCWRLAQGFLVPRELTLPRPPLARRGRGRWIAGAAFVVRRSEFLDAGGFDEEFFLYFEDFDLSRRYRARGLPIRTTDAFTVSHVGHGSSPPDVDLLTSFALLSLIQLVAKWEGRARARSAARWCLGLLRMLEATARAFALVPLLGGRPARKRDSAAAVRSYLAAAALRSPVEGTYAAAVDALAHALGARMPPDRRR